MSDADLMVLLSAMLGCTFVILAVLMHVMRRITERSLERAMSRTDRPMAVVFSPESPHPAGHIWADVWVRTGDKVQVLTYDPKNGGWHDSAFSHGLGWSRIDGELCFYRTLPGHLASDEDLAKFDKVATSGTLPDGFLAELAMRDEADVFAVVEALGIVRQFDRALAKIEAKSGQTLATGSRHGLRRKLDL